PLTKLFYTGPMFRYERPQKGRYRQFYQIGAEVLGEGSAMADAEALKMLSELFSNLGVEGADIEINSLGCSRCRPLFKAGLKKFLEDKADRLCGDCIRRIERNPLRVLDCKVEGCIEATSALDAPSIPDFLCEACGAHFESLKQSVKTLGVLAKPNPRMVRGLDYYTRTTFEVTAGGSGGGAGGALGSQNAIAAGGRYDGLVEELGGPPTPCFGFAIGMERLALLIDRKRIKRNPLTLFIAIGEEASMRGFEVVEGLRRGGLSVVVDFSAGPLKRRMKRADRMGARYVIILGEDEVKGGVLTVKDMTTGAQEKIPSGGAAGWITGR
ncbi:MAG: histidine--tRNA ligase, partial [Deltaproteobacteria bacterium]|nr:histidine--tRNA ligase [Deltaproteobacteria bacterium]